MFTVEYAIIVPVSFLLTLVYDSFGEWAIHRYMHNHPRLWFQRVYGDHVQVHHRIYRGDASYVAGERPHRELTLKWWAEPFPLATHLPVLVALGIWLSIPTAVACFVAAVLYQGTYEYLHYCMHVPTGRWFERTVAFRWLNAHHQQHHRKHNTNFNVLLPIADYVLRTHQSPAREENSRRRPVKGMAQAEMPGT